jgi:hypothetical protein
LARCATVNYGSAWVHGARECVLETFSVDNQARRFMDVLQTVAAARQQ